jgi:hypothetical protein
LHFSSSAASFRTRRRTTFVRRYTGWYRYPGYLSSAHPSQKVWMDSLDKVFLFFNPGKFGEMGFLLSRCLESARGIDGSSSAYLGPHLCSDDTDILMPNLDGCRNQLGIHNVFPEENKRISRSRDMFRMLLCLIISLVHSRSMLWAYFTSMRYFLLILLLLFLLFLTCCPSSLLALGGSSHRSHDRCRDRVHFKLDQLRCWSPDLCLEKFRIHR